MQEPQSAGLLDLRGRQVPEHLSGDEDFVGRPGGGLVMPRTARRPRARRPSTARHLAPARPAPASAAPAVTAPARSDLVHEIEGLRYELERLPRASARTKTVVSVRLATQEREARPPLVDRVDFYASRSRRAFAELVAETFGREASAIMGHIALILDACERAQAEEDRPVVATLTPARRAAAEKLLASRDLLDQAASAMESLGHVGEESAKRLAFLVAISRLLARPLSALLIAPSGSGKSAVLDAVAALVPPEHLVVSSRLTAGSLYYAGRDALRHRLILVDEFDGQADAALAVRVLQSRGALSLTTTVQGRTETFSVEGPVAVMSGTTSPALDLQNTSRCLELSLDDSPEQTARVHEAQARAWAGRGPQAPDRERWHDAQRLLAEELPAQVVVPFAERIGFPARATTDRRSSAKLLGLIASVAVLHARQRDRDAQGRIIARAEDYRVVHDLMRPLIDASLDGLSARATSLYRALAELPEPFNRRQVKVRIGWPYMTTARALDELVKHELVRATSGKKPVEYRFLDRSLLGAGACLTPPEAIEGRARRS